VLGRRERELAQLLAGGLSNREIAGRLYLWGAKVNLQARVGLLPSYNGRGRDEGRCLEPNGEVSKKPRAIQRSPPGLFHALLHEPLSQLDVSVVSRRVHQRGNREVEGHHTATVNT
jgi:hypothetical protein